MQTKKWAAIVLSGISLCSLHQVAHAHDAWLARPHDNYHVLYGRDSSNTAPYRPKDISEAQAIQNGMARPLAIKRTDTFAYMDAGDAGMVSATLLQGFRSSTPEGQYHSMSKPEALAKFGKVETSTYRALCAVAHTNEREQLKSVDYVLELTPQFNPSKARKESQEREFGAGSSAMQRPSPWPTPPSKATTFPHIAASQD